MISERHMKDADFYNYAPSPSTTDGGATPLTDMSSPMFCFGRNLTDLSRSVATNCLSIQLRATEYRLDEYSVNSSVDMVCYQFNLIAGWVGSSRIVMFTKEEATRLMVISRIGWVPPSTVGANGIQIVYVQSHGNLSNCFCAKCETFLSFLTSSTEGTKIRRNQFIPSLVIPPPGIDLVAIPGHSLWPSRSLRGIAVDTIVKFSCAPVLVNSKNLTKSTVVQTIYNNQVYTVKGIVFDKTPSDSFFNKKTKKLVSYAQHVASMYPGFIARNGNSCMIEVYGEKKSETCLLIPEFVSHTNSTVCKQIRVASKERFATIKEIQNNFSLRKWNECFVYHPIELLNISTTVGVPEFSSASLAWGIVYEGASSELIACLVQKLCNLISPPQFVETAHSESHMDALLKRKSDVIVLVVLKHKNRYARLKQGTMGQFVTQMVRLDALVAKLHINSEFTESLASELQLKGNTLKIPITPFANYLVVGIHFYKSKVLITIDDQKGRFVTRSFEKWTDVVLETIKSHLLTNDGVFVLINENSCLTFDIESLHECVICLSWQQPNGLRIDGNGVFLNDSVSFFVVPHTRPCLYTLLVNSSGLSLPAIGEEVMRQCDNGSLPRVSRRTQKCYDLMMHSKCSCFYL